MKGRSSSLLSQKPVSDAYPAASVIEETFDADRTLYLGIASGKVNHWGSVGVAAILGFGSTALLFLVLPLCQVISFAHKATNNSTMVNLSIAPPPAPIVAELPPPPEKKRIEAPTFRGKIPKLSLTQLALALNPGAGDGVGGDFSMNFEIEAIDYVEAIFEIGEVDRAPRPTYTVAPAYPYKLKQSGIGGTVWLYFVCDARGRVKDIRVESSTNLKFEEQAIRALRNWKFEPGIKDGKKVNVQMLIPFTFRVREKKW
jgi:protein TonB